MSLAFLPRAVRLPGESSCPIQNDACVKSYPEISKIKNDLRQAEKYSIIHILKLSRDNQTVRRIKPL